MTIADPRDIPGLLAWYSAEAITGLTDGDQITQWTDLSGLNNHATAFSGSSGIKPKWRATGGAGGGPWVEFTNAGAPFDMGGGPTSGDGYFKLPVGLMGSAASGEIMAQLKSSASFTGLWAFGSSPGNYNGSHYPGSNGHLYDAWGLIPSQRQDITPTMSLTTWRRYNVWSASNDWTARLDGVVQRALTTATVAWESKAPLLGAIYSYASTDVDMKFQGGMGAVVIYGRKLTTAERADLDTWLQANPSGGTVSTGGTVSLSLAGTLPAIQSSLTLASYTDTVTDNDWQGRVRAGSFQDESEEPVEPLPAGLTRAVRVDKALAYPTPTIIDGRPT